MRNYWGEIINGEVGDLVKGRCDFERVARVVEIAANGYNITIEETPYGLACGGWFYRHSRGQIQNWRNSPQVHHKQRFNLFSERERGGRIMGAISSLASASLPAFRLIN
ncbi:hypothetical protein QUA41_27755 [Microcoleus sp. Pol11C1]|uniref:hypothetical protein n=1 Tax=unclassified Microcoleus TaxID=2642155 RepID=UPI002FD332D7